MVFPAVLRRSVIRRSFPSSAAPGGESLHFSIFCERKSTFALSSATETVSEQKNEKGSNRWFTLPPFTATANGSALGNRIMNGGAQAEAETSTTAITALKWVFRCCPELPRSLVQKLFRLRKVRRGSSMIENSECNLEARDQLKRVAANDILNIGDKLCLPISVQVFPTERAPDCCNKEEKKFIHSLVLYKDPAILAINKPPGLPVQGGIGVKRSLDQLAASCLSYDYSEPPRLVHRLDRDSSGILIMGRTSTSTSVLHSIFREKTLGASKHANHVDSEKKILQKRYWALVIGSPRRTKGLITAPLVKMVLDDGRSEQIMVIDNAESMPFQHAITTYKVIKSHHGYTWLELCPLTGRKHQLRVHCAEVLGTPIVGDYKYGWQAHRNWKPFPHNSHKNQGKKQSLPFGLDFESGSIAENSPRLHLHCKQLTLPDVSCALHNDSLDHDCSRLERLELDAPLPSYMQRSWDIINN
ncbi:RNA pseudouridine synthase 4, mitochondrial, partial [Cucurbita argyrosperma subsp. argyrosperma]